MQKDPFERARRALEETTLDGPGTTDARLRRAIAALGDVPDELRPLVEKIERDPSRVTEQDLVSLKGKYSEDQLFEILISAAMGASMRRLEAGLRALEGA